MNDETVSKFNTAEDWLIKQMKEADETEFEIVCFLLRLTKARKAVHLGIISNTEASPATTASRSKRWSPKEINTAKDKLTELNGLDKSVSVTQALIDAVQEALPDRSRGSVSAKIHELRNAAAEDK